MSHPVERSALSETTSEARRARRWVWAAVGWLCVALGTIGAFVPLLPSTVFFIIAAACFARSYPRWERWLLGLPRFGPLIRDYRAGLGMPRRAKIIAISMIAGAVTLSIGLARPPWFVSVGGIALGGIGIWYIAWRVPTREQVLRDRAAASEQAGTEETAAAP